MIALALLSATPTLSHASDRKPAKRAKKKRVPAKELELAAPGNVPPGAQLTPNRVIDAPQAPGPDSTPKDRVEVPARAIAKPKKDTDVVQPPYPTGPDPGRNLQPANGFNPSSQPIVP